MGKGLCRLVGFGVLHHNSHVDNLIGYSHMALSWSWRVKLLNWKTVVAKFVTHVSTYDTYFIRYYPHDFLCVMLPWLLLLYHTIVAYITRGEASIINAFPEISMRFSYSILTNKISVFSVAWRLSFILCVCVGWCYVRWIRSNTMQARDLLPGVLGYQVWLYLAYITLPILYLWIRFYVRCKVLCYWSLCLVVMATWTLNL